MVRRLEEEQITVDQHVIHVTHPDKILWPSLEIRKIDYLQYLLTIAPYLIAHTCDRLLMTWSYPEGISGRRVESRSRPVHAPEWVEGTYYKDKQRVFLNNAATLVWLANRGALEFHVPFDRYTAPNMPMQLAFDLDPAGTDQFDLVLEVALRLHSVLDSLGLNSVPRTSGATGLQIFVPIQPMYTFEETRLVNHFVARYLHEQMPDKLTLERAVNRRGGKLYFDYLQLWRGRTMPAIYSVRAQPGATVSTPVTWGEVEQGFRPDSFTVLAVSERISRTGDLFGPVTGQQETNAENLDAILSFIRSHDSGG